MATAQPAYDYSAYDYSYDTSSTSAYPGYEYESYAPQPPPPTGYEGYPTSTTYPTESSYHSTDPYAGYPTASYGYPPPPPSTAGAPPPATHYPGYDYTSSYKPSGSYHVPAPTGMIPHRPEYYPPHGMHYVHHQQPTMPYRMPPKGGYQRELDEPGDENELLRHVIYITGLPKEIQNETLADVFGSACGIIAPVDVRSPKLKIWVYKDRQTREGKGEATITFINPESCQTAISYFNGKELFGREIRVTLCPRRMYNMQKQNTPFNPAAPPSNSTTSNSSMNKTTATNIDVTTANPIATISSSTLGLPRQLNHSLFKLRQTADQQRGLLPTPPVPYGTPMMNNPLQRDGVRKELPRVALNKNATINTIGTRPKPY